jgi:peptidoglycan/xylan/chitin deacetylase (PgdA/CDA1 family)
MPHGKIILTFDVEEFDVPLEYGHSIPLEEQIEITTAGVRNIQGLLLKHQIRCTFFTTAVYAQRQPALIKTVSEKHEIASHGYSHSFFSADDLSLSKEILESIIKKPLYGFRMARLAPVDDSDIEKAGYAYNSSLNPTWIPGRYNHSRKPRSPFFNGNLLNIPTSVTPFFRVPLFWLSFKNFPLWFSKSLMLRTLKYDGFLSLYFHPWEFVEINVYGLPWFISRMSGKDMMERLDYAINVLKREADFITMHDFCMSQFQPGLLQKQP